MLEVSTPTAQPSLHSRIMETCRRLVQRLPPKARLPVFLGALAVVALCVYLFILPGSSDLTIVCHHGFQSAELSVSVDGKPSYTERIYGSQKKLLGVFGSHFQGSSSKSLSLSSGKHEIQAHLVSAEDGFDETRTREVDLESGKESTLVVAAKRDDLSMIFEGARSSADSSPSAYFASVRTLLVTVIGSAVSAVIGFFVQEFLRSRKTA